MKCNGPVEMPTSFFVEMLNGFSGIFNDSRSVILLVDLSESQSDMSPNFGRTIRFFGLVNVLVSNFLLYFSESDDMFRLLFGISLISLMDDTSDVSETYNLKIKNYNFQKKTEKTSIPSLSLRVKNIRNLHIVCQESGLRGKKNYARIDDLQR